MEIVDMLALQQESPPRAAGQGRDQAGRRGGFLGAGIDHYQGSCPVSACP